MLGATFETVDITELPPPADEGEPSPPTVAAESVPSEAAAEDETYFLDADALELEDRERS
jgi:hypothetical protein